MILCLISTILLTVAKPLLQTFAIMQNAQPIYNVRLPTSVKRASASPATVRRLTATPAPSAPQIPTPTALAAAMALARVRTSAVSTKLASAPAAGVVHIKLMGVERCSQHCRCVSVSNLGSFDHLYTLV
jgi:hypothetical protein